MTREEIMQLNTDYLNGCESEHKMNELFSYALEQQPCGDAISRQAVNNLQRYRYNCGDTSITCISLKSVNELPPVTPQTIEQEPCEDAISREEYINCYKAFDYSENGRRTSDDALAIRVANSLPPVTARQKYGKWIKQTLSVKPFGEDTVLCDQCAFMTDKDSMYNYCPNCGAKMVEPQESEEV